VVIAPVINLFHYEKSDVYYFYTPFCLNYLLTLLFIDFCVYFLDFGLHKKFFPRYVDLYCVVLVYNFFLRKYPYLKRNLNVVFKECLKQLMELFLNTDLQFPIAPLSL